MNINGMRFFSTNTFINLLLCLLVSTQLSAAESQGAFITQSSGNVSFIVSDGESQPLPAFAKVYASTKIIVEAQGKLQVVYLDTGQQESWVGPAELIVGQYKTQAIKSSEAPMMKTLPPFMVSVLTQSNDVINDIKARQGMIRVRSLMTARKVIQVEKNYEELRKNAADDDISPEIYYLTALDQLKVYKRMTKPLNEILIRQPNNQAAKVLHDEFMALLNNENAAKN
jgi:hypothetical protein